VLFSSAGSDVRTDALSTEATVAPPSPRLEQAFLELYDREAPVVLAYLRAATGDDAEDLAAETFLRAWRRWPAYRATDRQSISLPPWGGRS